MKTNKTEISISMSKKAKLKKIAAMMERSIKRYHENNQKYIKMILDCEDSKDLKTVLRLFKAGKYEEAYDKALNMNYTDVRYIQPPTTISMLELKKAMLNIIEAVVNKVNYPELDLFLPDENE